MSVHVYPLRDDTHDTSGLSCWCNPRIEWSDPETGEAYAESIVVHNAPDGYDEGAA
jgi:hypothetical protein